jgi:hypothetical protein
MRLLIKLLGIAVAGLSISYATVVVPTPLDSLQAAVDRVDIGRAWAQWYSPKQSAKQIPAVAILLPDTVDTYFGAVAGGGAPSYNEIALEKNLLYFQRSLSHLGLDPISASLFFANGNSGEATVRYLDENDREQFKAPEIANLDGAASYANTRGWFEALANAEKPCPAFFYFTGHGAYNDENEDDNGLVLWEEVVVSVSEMAGWLDALPADQDQPFVTMMAQCYSGSFANLIYENGDPLQPVALQTRCGFFATVASRPSVGCTPAVNEADYKDYSSSFFAGLSGRDRTGRPVASADYSQDGKVSYAEAHAFAKVDEATTDWPISTVEAWLQRQLSTAEQADILTQTMAEWEAIARPEQQYVVRALSAKLNFDLAKSFQANQASAPIPQPGTVIEAYVKRLEMELTNIAAEKQIRERAISAEATASSADAVTVLEKLIRCEAGGWE